MAFRIDPSMEEYRLTEGGYRSRHGVPYGAFSRFGPCGVRLYMLATDGRDDSIKNAHGWEHVSVSSVRRVPNWPEMCWVKKLFWEAEDCVVQFHPPASQYVDFHPRTLHLWRHIDAVFPQPPPILVGPA